MIPEGELVVQATRAAGAKCPRCGLFHLMALNFDNLCDRCCHVLVDDFPDHESVPGIKESYAAQRTKWNVGSNAG